MKIGVVIPAYNEAERIGAVLSKLPAKVLGHEVVGFVVDDGSADDTAGVARKAHHLLVKLHVMRHKVNLGKGAAAKTGCDAAVKYDCDIIVLMDADGQHRPEDLENMVKPLISNSPKDGRKIELVLGVRVRNGNMPFVMRLGNFTMNFLARSLFKIVASDSQSGYRAFVREAYPKIRWAAPRYAMETEMLILAARNRVKSVEVPIPTIYLDDFKGTTILDGLRIVQTLLKWKILWLRESKSLESYSL